MGNVRVLELRIHGIANAPPADALLAKDEEIVRDDGDQQGSFWRIKQAPGDALYTAGDGPTVITEAYSWGNQARTGGTALAVVGRAFVHVGWLLVLPFGLCNLAYWARRDIKGEAEKGGLWHGGDGAAWIRIFAMLQTLFYTVGLLTVSVHLIGMECFPAREDGEPAQVCAALPTWTEFLAYWTPNARAALLGLVPILVILFIYIVGLRARAGFHPTTSFDQEVPVATATDDADADADSPPKPPLLASAGFWQRTRTAEGAERTHLAAVFSFVVTLFAADALLDATGGDLRAVILDPAAAAAAAPVPFWMTLAAGGLLVWAFLLAAVGAMSGRIHDDRIKRAFATGILSASIVAYGFWVVWAIFIDSTSPADYSDPAEAEGLSGLVLVPTTIAGLGALIALASLSWGYARFYQVVCVALIVTALGCALYAATFLQDFSAQLTVSLISAGLVVLAVGASYLPLLNSANRERSRIAGWHGNGAAVTLLIAWFSSLVITSLLVLGAYAFLSADADGGGDVVDHLRTVDVEQSDPIATPVFYSRFAGMLVLILGVLIVAALVAMIASLRRFPAFSLPGLMFPQDLDADALAAQQERDRPLGGVSEPVHGYPASEHKPSGRLRTVADARRVAGLAHRGEPILLVLAIMTASALLFLGIPVLGGLLVQLPFWADITAVSGWAIGLFALAAVAWVVTNAVTSTERPLGLVWDIVCFFPRAGHPFTPPCYAERAVPEVTKRVRHFIDDEKKAGRDPYVILSAHSMGATIAVAAIFAMLQDEAAVNGSRAAGKIEIESRLPRVALLTHGVQLRAYFSRFFTEVFGARVLGIRGTAGPSLVRSDPWRRQVMAESEQPRVDVGEPGDPQTIVRLLGGDLRSAADWRAPRWRSLWRRTDYLGFPVLGYWSTPTGVGNTNPIDRGATERDPKSYLWKVARHNDYLSTAQYREARQELIDGFTETGADRLADRGGEAEAVAARNT